MSHSPGSPPSPPVFTLTIMFKNVPFISSMVECGVSYSSVAKLLSVKQRTLPKHFGKGHLGMQLTDFRPSKLSFFKLF